MRIPFLSGALTGAVFLSVAVLVAVLHPASPLPREWNPREPLLVSDPYSPLTRWKAARAAGSLEQCLAALDTADVRALEPLETSETCGIAQRVTLSGVGSASIVPVETDCSVALKLALWEQHDLQDIAAEVFGARVTEVSHFSSYSCRRIRTTAGAGAVWSTHATGQAIDVSGFRLSDGREINLLRDWDGSPQEQSFLRAAQTSACRWFGGVLGPNFNALHADHFHLQTTGRRFCR